MNETSFSNGAYVGQLFVEAAVVGLVTLVLGLIVIGLLLFIQSKISGQPMPSWSTLGVIAAGLFLTGVIAHFSFEALGVNKFYLTKSAAARRNQAK